MTANPLVAFARHVVDTPSERAVELGGAPLRTFLLDTLGVGLAGNQAPKLDGIRRAVAGWGVGADATVWGLGDKASVAAAAFLNAYMAHAQEFDCVHERAVAHVLTPTLAVALPDAERLTGIGRKVGGRDFAAALSLGLDVGCIIGMAARSPMRFFRPATAGAFAAYAALARLRGFDLGRTMQGFGILFGQLGGTMQAHHEGSMMLGIQMGFGAVAAVRAADLAEAGVTAPQDVLMGPFGFFSVFEPEHDLPGAMAELGRIGQATRLSHKPFPCGRLSHPSIDGLQRLLARRPLAPEQVRRVVLRLPPLAIRLVGRPPKAEQDANYARLCLPYLIAVTLRRGTVGLGDFTDEALADPATHALAAKVVLQPDGTTDPNAIAPQAVVIELADGSRVEETVPIALGHPDNPLSRERHLQKFRTCAAVAVQAAEAERLIALVDHLQDLDDALELQPNHSQSE